MTEFQETRAGVGEAEEPMRFRKLRIAWSAGCGTACLLFGFFWVRSFWWEERLFYISTEPSTTSLISNYGTLLVYRFSGPPAQSKVGWHYTKRPAGREYAGFRWKWYKYSPNMPKSKVIVSADQTPVRMWSYVDLPYWLLVAVTGLPVAVLELYRTRQWRFSFRTLLIATTLVAVVSGLIVWANR